MTGVPDRGEGRADVHVEYGMWERRDDLPPRSISIRETSQLPLPLLLLSGRRLGWETITLPAVGRKRFEFWIGDDGKKYGRWNWDEDSP